ncbi:MAG: alginate lyase family protein [Bacillota bacterium]
MRLSRVLHADLRDLANRGWQEVSRSIDRLAVGAPGDAGIGSQEAYSAPAWSPHVTAREPGRSAIRDDAHARLGAFRRNGAERFFAGVGDQRLPGLFISEMPEARARILAAADAVCSYSFRLLGHRALFLGHPIDWHRDAVSGKRAPLVHWSRIDPLDMESVGDSKVTWELNRHQWLVELGQAYRLSGDERYASMFAACVRDWIRANPPGMGINWASSLEVSYRMISWCWALNLFRDSAALTPALYADMLESMCAHAGHVERYLSHYFSPNTHLTGEALGLFYAGVLLPELPRAQRWLKLGMRVLLEQLPRQVLSDGVYFEQSTCYQRYTAEIYLHFLVLAARNGIPVPKDAQAQVCRVVDYLLAICRPDGSMPQIGDTDGGRLLPLSPRGADDCRDVLALSAAFFKRADYAWAARGRAPETAWLLGPAGCEAFDALEARPPPHPPSRLFADGGWAVMQGGWEPDAPQLLFDVGPLGCSVSGGHGHADLLSVQCSPFGHPLLVDPGTYCYTAHANWRDHFRGSAAHNTVVIDRQSQAAPAGPFSWRKRPAAELLAWRSAPRFDYADAVHDAYGRLRDPVRHRRRVLFVKPRYWVVVDDLLAADVHQVDLLFQFGTVSLSRGGNGWMRAAAPDGRGLLVRPFSTATLETSIHEGEVEPIRAWVSPDYGLRAPAPLLCYGTLTRLPLSIVTLLIPAEEGGEPPAVAVVQAEGLSKLVFDGGRETIRVDDRQITVEHEGELGITPLMSE